MGVSNGVVGSLAFVAYDQGGPAVVMYVITRRIKEKPHRLSRLIQLSPAGFHKDSNLCFTFPHPTRFSRMLLNKSARDFHNYPAVGGLVQTSMSYLVGGDNSKVELAWSPGFA
ncbi:hypothetical protein YC2023_095480 [Brassica napus]